MRIINIKRPHSGSIYKNLRCVTNRFLRRFSFHYGLECSLGKPEIEGIEITNICNFRCSMCTINYMTRKKEVMSFEKFKKYVDQLYPSNDYLYYHFIGDPLVNPDVSRMISYVKSKGHKTGLLTNGGLLTEEKSKEIIEAGLDALGISFEIVERTFNKTRRGGNFQQVKMNILNFLNIKKKIRSGKPKVEIHSITFPNCEKEVKQATKFWQGKVDVVHNRLLHSWAGDIPQIVEFFQNSGMLSNSKNGMRICRFPWLTMIILVDGRVIPCCVDYDAKYVVGDLNKESLKEIWNGKKMVALRKALLEGRKEEIELCSKCTYGPNLGERRNKLFFLPWART